MKKANIENTWPEIDAWYGDRKPSLFLALVTGFVFWMGLIGLILWIGIGSARAESVAAISQADPMVMKIYPDGTKVVLHWSEVGKTIDNGEKFGGAPRIVAYDPAKDGIVPIGEPSSKTTATNSLVQGSGSEGIPDQSPKLDLPTANSDNIEGSNPGEGFYVGLQLGGAVVQNIDLNYSSGTSYALVLNPGIRLDIPVGYRFNEWFSLEFAPGMIYNKFADIQNPQSVAIGGYLMQVPMLVNAIVTIPTGSSFEPFFGAGFGGVFSKISLSGDGGIGASDVSGSSWAYGYSALAGLNYHLDKDISVGFVYKFTGTTGQNWTGDILGTSTTVFTQSVEANATFRF